MSVGIEKAKPSSKERYDEWHLNRAQGERDVSFLHPWHETVLRLLPDLGGCEILEIGCGRGDFSLELARRFPSARVTGIDFSDSAIEIASARSKQRGSSVRFLAADAQMLPFPARSFDWIISCECLEHVPNPQDMANEMSRMLRKGGKYILTTENYLNGMLLAWAMSALTRQPFDSGSGVQPLEHFFFFWKVRRMLLRAGLDVSHMESNHFQWLLLPHTDPAKLCTRDFNRPWLKRMFRPFGRHFTFYGALPTSDAPRG